MKNDELPPLLTILEEVRASLNEGAKLYFPYAGYYEENNYFQVSSVVGPYDHTRFKIYHPDDASAEIDLKYHRSQVQSFYRQVQMFKEKQNHDL